jgi:hypothetical protein
MKVVNVRTKDSITMYVNGKTFAIGLSHPNFESIKNLLLADADWSEISPLVEFEKNYTFSAEGVEVKYDDKSGLVLVLDGMELGEIDNVLKKRLIEMAKALHEDKDDGLKNSATMFARFIRKLYNNPSRRSVLQLFGFLEFNDLPLTADGNFLAYKKIGYDYKDIYSHTFDNSVGKTAKMIRNQVDDDPSRTCSKGLHVCSFDYLGSFGSCRDTLDRIVVCEVDPANVVSIPTDYNNAKMRVCEYTVVGEIPQDLEAKLSRYVYGKHKEGWIEETLRQLEKVYTEFYGDAFKFNGMTADYSLTDTDYDKFLALFDKTFVGLNEKARKEIEEDIESIIHYPSVAFQILSALDGSSLTPAEVKANENKVDASDEDDDEEIW